MKLAEVLEFSEPDLELLDEGAKRAYRRYGFKIVNSFRCTSGPKKGKLVSDPSKCGSRKDPAKVRHGRKVARNKKAARLHKSKLTKKTAQSKMLKKMNKRLG